MRILFVNRMVNMERGGGETFDLEIAKHLQLLGCEISFLSGIPLFSGSRIKAPFSGFRLPLSGFCLRTPYFGWFPWDKVRGGWRLRMFDFWVFEKMAVKWALRRQSDYDIVQVCELPTFVAEWKKNTRVPVVIRLTAPNYYDPENGIEKADAVFASGMTVEELRSSKTFACADIPNAVDTGLFCPGDSDFRTRMGISREEMVILYVARFQDFKNHGLLLKAFASFLRRRSRARLILVGEGPLRRRFVQEAYTLGISHKVLFVGAVPFEGMPAIYRAADIKVISSDFESFCFAALEAMASGLPIITTDCGWVPRLLSESEQRRKKDETSISVDQFIGIDSNSRVNVDRVPVTGVGAQISFQQGGVVVHRNNADDFSEALYWLAGNGDIRRKMGKFNRNKAMGEHSWDASAKQVLAMYQKLVAHR